MRGGLLRHRITIEQRESGVDTLGQPLDGWSVVSEKVPAEVRDIRGREFWVSQQVPAGEVTTRVRVRYRTDLTRQMRILHQAAIFEIVAILDPDGRSTELHLMCREMS